MAISENFDGPRRGRGENVVLEIFATEPTNSSTVTGEVMNRTLCGTFISSGSEVPLAAAMRCAFTSIGLFLFWSGESFADELGMEIAHSFYTDLQSDIRPRTDTGGALACRVVCRDAAGTGDVRAGTVRLGSDRYSRFTSCPRCPRCSE